MAQSTNNVTLVGRLTRAPEYRSTKNGTTVATLPIAFTTTRKVGDEWTEESNFIDGSLWGRQAEALQPYLVKGKQLAVEGSLHMDRWENNEGEKRSKITLNIRSAELLGGNPGHADAGRDENRGEPVGAAAGGSSSSFDDDVPF